MKHKISPEKYEKALFEKLRYEFLSPTFRVIEDDKVKGRYSRRRRQLDVAVYRNGQERPFWVADAKRHSRRIDVKTVECFIGMLDDVDAKIGILVSLKGFSGPAERRAKASKIITYVMSISEALEMNWRPIARQIYPWDWAFHPDLAAALHRLQRKDEPIHIVDALEQVPFEEWLSFVRYGLENHSSEAVDFLWFVALHHYDDGWRYNAVQQLIYSGFLGQLDVDRLLSQENDPEIIELLTELGFTR